MRDWMNIFTCRTGRAEELEGSNSPENNIFSAVPKPVIWTNKLVPKPVIWINKLVNKPKLKKQLGFF